MLPISRRDWVVGGSPVGFCGVKRSGRFEGFMLAGMYMAEGGKSPLRRLEACGIDRWVAALVWRYQTERRMAFLTCQRDRRTATDCIWIIVSCDNCQHGLAISQAGHVSRSLFRGNSFASAIAVSEWVEGVSGLGACCGPRNGHMS